MLSSSQLAYFCKSLDKEKPSWGLAFIYDHLQIISNPGLEYGLLMIESNHELMLMSGQL